jgi:hypothetical protein
VIFIAPVKYPTGVIDSSRKYFYWPSLPPTRKIFNSEKKKNFLTLVILPADGRLLGLVFFKRTSILPDIFKESTNNGPPIFFIIITSVQSIVSGGGG